MRTPAVSVVSVIGTAGVIARIPHANGQILGGN